MPAISGTRRLLFTAQRASRDLALHELLDNLPGAQHEAWLSDQVGALWLPREWGAIARRIAARPPVFCRHICPASHTCDISLSNNDIAAIVAAASVLLPGLDPSRTFSVQTRLIGEGKWPYGRYDLNQALSQAWAATGAELDVRAPEQVLSLNVTQDQAYVGLSNVDENLSTWTGGEQRFRREKGQISRAEFKLLEALSVWGIDLPTGALALDLGAAPGGWTRVAINRGLRVVAVDPAELHPSLRQDPRVEHARTLAQPFLRRDERTYALIVNDMRMDAAQSAEIMLHAADKLEPNGLAIMTVKLPSRSQPIIVRHTLDALSRRYDIIGARQLFHNRSEVTICLRRQIE